MQAAPATIREEVRRKTGPPTTGRWPWLLRILTRLVFLVLLGATATVLVAWACALLVNPLAGAVLQGTGYTNGDEQWSVTRYSTSGAVFIETEWESGFSWSPRQATGPPDAISGIDHASAWASQASDGGPEWLLVTFPRAAVPKAIHIHESHCPGAVHRITVFSDTGEEVEAWQGTDPTPEGNGSGAFGISQIPLSGVNFKTSTVKIHLDSLNVAGWNEIDAVELVDQAGDKQWASGAHASSWYGSAGATAGLVPGPIPEIAAPQWSGLAQPSKEFRESRVRTEQRAADGRGWPMIALMTERLPLAAGGGQVVAGGAAAVPGSSGPAATLQPVTATGGRTLGGRNTFVVTPGVGGTPVMRLKPVLPWRPVWPGFLVNTALFSILLAIGYWLLTLPRRFVMEVARMRRGCCIGCGYDLGYDFRAGCPWCGWRREGKSAGEVGANGNGDAIQR